MASADRTLDLIEAFSEQQTPLLISEISALLNVPKSTCSELLKTLKQRGYIYSLGSRRGFYPTRKLLVHAQVIAAHDPTAARLDGMMSGLRDATGETVIAGRLLNDAVIYLAVVDGLHTIRYSTAPGDIKPLHSSAIGKALLSVPGSPQIASLSLAQYTPHTICDADRLVADIERGRQKGYFTTTGENVEDVMALSAVVDLGGDYAAVAVAGPIERVRQNEARIASALLAATHAFDKAG